MSNAAIKINTTDSKTTESSATDDSVSHGNVSVEAQSAPLSDKRMAQHAHWMRVMMEGQSTPDLRYQRSQSKQTGSN